MDIEGALIRTMFGCRAVYGRGRLLLVLADGDEPWNGALFPVERERHAEVLARWPTLREHPILPKWLHLPESAEGFEFLAQQLVREIRQGNPLFGVVPPARKRRRSSQQKGPRDDGGSQMPPHLRR
jgi:hypothetical protein